MRLNLPDQCMGIARIRQVTVVEKETPVILSVRHEMIDPLRTGCTVPTDNAMDLIALFKQKLGQI